MAPPAHLVHVAAINPSKGFEPKLPWSLMALMRWWLLVAGAWHLFTFLPNSENVREIFIHLLNGLG
jgi:hypothetical protein